MKIPCLEHVSRLLAAIACFAGSSVSALYYWPFTYDIVDEGIRIRGVSAGIAHVEVPTEIFGTPVYAIWNGSFTDNTDVESVVIPEGVIEIRNYAFAGCSALASVSVPNTVTFLGGHAFEGCTSLESVSLGSGIDILNHSLFKDCVSLMSITIPDEIQEVSGHVFQNCSSLESIVVPGSVTDLGNYSFSGCTALKDLTIGNGVMEIGNNAFEACSSLPELLIPPSVGTIGGGAFSGCVNLQSVEIPDTITYLGYGVFDSCDNLTVADVGSGITYLRPLFYGCANLESLTIGSGVSEIMGAAFDNLPGLKEILVSSENAYFTSRSGVLYNKALETLIKYPSAKAGSFTIPAEVRLINAMAFQRCEYLTEIFLPQYCNVQTWPGGFGGCPNLEKFTVDWLNFHYESVDGVLFNQDMDQLFFYPPAKAGPYTIPDGVDIVHSYAFLKCHGLTEINFPSSVSYMGDEAFRECTQLQRLEFPPYLDYVGKQAFRECVGLTRVVFQQSLRELDFRAFFGCENLTGAYFHGSPPIMNETFYFNSHPYFALYHINSVSGWDGFTHGGIPVYPFDYWCGELPMVTGIGTIVDTYDWLGCFEISHRPWTWCYDGECWLNFPEIAQTDSGAWFYAPDSVISGDHLLLTMLGGTDWAWSESLGSWLYMAGDGWIHVPM